MDVAFDQFFLSSVVGTSYPFSQSQAEKDIGKIGGPAREHMETTGDITTLTDYVVSNWGEDSPDETTTSLSSPFPPIDTPDDESISSESSTSDASSTKSSFDHQLGSQIIDGTRRSTRLKHSAQALQALSSKFDDIDLLKAEHLMQALAEGESIFQTLDIAALDLDIPLDPYLPEPRSLDDIKRLPPQLQKDWLAAAKKELKFVIENGTLDGGEELIHKGDEVIPCMLVYKAKITSRGFWTN